MITSNSAAVRNRTLFSCPIRSLGFQPKTFSTPSLAKKIFRSRSPITAWGIDSRIEASRASSSASLLCASFCSVMSMELPRMAFFPRKRIGVTVSMIQRVRPSFVLIRKTWGVLFFPRSMERALRTTPSRSSGCT
ncbi:MAG: hypothetical protein A4E67_00591 [Syntrophaceae bacterium PtaB.Bin038]|nr:MAG: hypothetical protein A4E67_00591 [Syntrophaceae bacterium PtaB.Bin038]